MGPHSATSPAALPGAPDPMVSCLWMLLTFIPWVDQMDGRCHWYFWQVLKLTWSPFALLSVRCCPPAGLPDLGNKNTDAQLHLSQFLLWDKPILRKYLLCMWNSLGILYLTWQPCLCDQESPPPRELKFELRDLEIRSCWDGVTLTVVALQKEGGQTGIAGHLSFCLTAPPNSLSLPSLLSASVGQSFDQVLCLP